MGTLLIFTIIAVFISSVLTIRTDWMKDVYGGTGLSRIAIPGTHDSGSYRTPIGETQTRSIGQQLYDGIRFFDVRISNTIFRYKKDIELRHGKLRLGSFKKLVMEPVNDFLTKYPSETVLMSIKDEDRLTHSRLQKYIDSSRYKFYKHKVKATTTLQSVRGKIVLFNRVKNFDSEIGVQWNDLGGKKYIQDEYNLHTECKTFKVLFIKKKTCGPHIGLDYPRKAREVTKYLKKASNGFLYGGKHFYINFASANYKGGYIAKSAGYSNGAVKKYFDNYDGLVGSIVLMDYPEKKRGVVSSIIKNALRNSRSVYMRRKEYFRKLRHGFRPSLGWGR